MDSVFKTPFLVINAVHILLTVTNSSYRKPQGTPARKKDKARKDSIAGNCAQFYYKAYEKTT